MPTFKQWQIVRIIKTGELATVYHTDESEGVTVFLQSGVSVTFNADSLSPIDNTIAESEAQSESAFKKAVLSAMVLFSVYCFYMAIQCASTKEPNDKFIFAFGASLGAVVATAYIAVVYFFSKNTQKPEPPLS